MRTFAIRSALAAFSIAALASTASAASIKAAKPTVSNTSNIVLAKGPRKHRHHRILSPRQIVRALHRQGFRHVHRISFHHGKYHAVARGRRGPVKLAISARSGRVVGRTPLHHRYGHNYRGGRNGFSWSFTIR